MNIKTFDEFIKESFGSGYGLNIVFVDVKGYKNREEMIFDNLQDIKKYMKNWLDKNQDGYIEYFDICKGSNYSDPNCLEFWGGQGGYFYNILNSNIKHKQNFSYRDIKRIEDREVNIDEYLFGN